MAGQEDWLDLIMPMLELGGSVGPNSEFIRELVSEVRSDPVGQWFLQRCTRRQNNWDDFALQEDAGSYPAKNTAETAASQTLPRIDIKKALVYTSDGYALFTPAETRLLVCLARQPGIVIPHNTLSEVISQDFTGAVWVDPKHHIRNLRIKLGDNLQQPCIIRSRRGIGYFLDEKMKGHIMW